MKKVFLLGALVCAGQMYGMESIEPENPQPELKIFQNLPDEVKNLILMAFAHSGNDFYEAIKNIKIASLTNKALNKMINDLQGFTEIVHILADKFDKTTMLVAAQFKTPTAKKYLQLGKQLISIQYDKSDSLDKAAQLISKGADINFSLYNPYDGHIITPLVLAIGYSDVKIIKFLLQSGANPIDEALFRALEMIHERNNEEAKEEAKEIFDIINLKRKNNP